MRIFVVALLLIAAILPGLASEKEPFSGKWQVRQNIADNESTQLCSFTQTGAELTGMCGNSGKFTGKVDGQSATWSYKVEHNGSTYTLKYSGTINAENHIVGTVLVEEPAVEGAFTATPEK
jgi:hypothetical protein